MLCPVALWQRGGLVPVVSRAVEQQVRPLARCKVNEAVGRIRIRDPDLEGRMRLERVGPVVLEDSQERAGMHQKAAETAAFECLAGCGAEALDVRTELC